MESLREEKEGEGIYKVGGASLRRFDPRVPDS